MPKPRGPKGGTTTILPGGLVKTAVYLEPEVKEALRRLSFEREVSISSLISDAIEEFLERLRGGK